jgi:hypothetical protein
VGGAGGGGAAVRRLSLPHWGAPLVARIYAGKGLEDKGYCLEFSALFSCSRVLTEYKAAGE